MRKRKTAIVKRVTTRSITNITPKFTSSSTDLLDNDQEMYRMERQEWLQRQVDNFWGLDKDLKDRNQELVLMGNEDTLSQRVERDIKILAQHRIWDYEFVLEEKQRIKREKDRRAYQRVDHLRLINSPLSVEELLHAIWNIDKGESLPLMPQIASLSFADVTMTNQSRSMTSVGGTGHHLHNQQGGVDGLQDSIASMGSMRMSLHLEGLQKTREIVEQAKGSFKAVLKDLHHNSQTQKSQAQKSQLLAKTNNNSLAEGSTGTFALVQQASVALGLTEASNNNNNNNLPTPPIDNTPRYNSDLEGHVDFHWDQEHALHRAFLLLDRGAKGFLTESDLQLLASDVKVRDLLQFTVYGAVIKRKEWSFFLDLLKQDLKALNKDQEEPPHMLAPIKTPSNSSLMMMSRGMMNKSPSFRSVMSNSSGGSSRQQSRSNLLNSKNKKNRDSSEALEEGGLTYRSWFEGAISLSREQNVLLKHIRTTAEHTAHCTKNNNHNLPNGNSNNTQQMQQQSYTEGEVARPFRVMRELHVGDTIWALHHNGTRWLPAVIKAIHNPTELTITSPVKAKSKVKTAVSFAVYDLWYPLSDQELFRSRLATTSRQLLSLPSMSQPTPILPLALPNIYNSSSFASSTSVQQPQPQQQLPVKALAHERDVCAYAFDLLDSGATGVVELQALAAAFQSPAMANVVHTSLVLQALFRGDTPISATNNTSTFMQSPSSVYTSSPIYVGSKNRNSKVEKKTASTPKNRKWWQAQAARLLQGKEKRKLPTLLSVFYDTFNDAHEEEEKERKQKQDDDTALDAGLLDEEMDSTKQQEETEVVTEDKPAASQQVCISKMDFLEFCDCIQEICRFDLGNLYDQNIFMTQ